MDIPDIPTVKLILLGTHGVGKTSLMVQFFDGIFPPEQEPSEQAVKLREERIYVTTCKRSVNVQCWDTSGYHRFEDDIVKCLEGMQGAILVYDVRKGYDNSLSTLKFWAKKILSHCAENVKLFVLANQAYGDSHCQVSSNNGRKFAEEINARFKETSAESFDDALLIFELLIYEILSGTDNASLSPTLSNKLGHNNFERNQACKALILLRPVCPVISGSPKRSYYDILVVGPSGAGKSNFISCYCDDTFDSIHWKTLGIQCRPTEQKGCNFGGRKLRFWDSGGSEQFYLMSRSIVGSVDGIILLADLMDDDLNYPGFWFDCTAHKIIIGNKCDLWDPKSRPANKEIGAFKYKYENFTKTSSKESSNVQIAINYLVQKIHLKRLNWYSKLELCFCPDYEMKMKIIMLGCSGVGKTSLMHTFVSDVFDPLLAVTVGVEMKEKKFRLTSSFGASILIWDTAGQEKFKSLVQSYYRKVHGVVLVYDVTSQDSFDELATTWLPQLAANSDQNLKKIIVGNKVDLGSRKVMAKEAEKFANKNGASHIETSAKDRNHVEIAFEYLINEILLDDSNKINMRVQSKKRKEDTNSKELVKLSSRVERTTAQPKKGRCC